MLLFSFTTPLVKRQFWKIRRFSKIVIKKEIPMNMAKAHAEAIPNCPCKNAMPGSPQTVRHCSF
ncbi:hypothetical protein C4N24_04485 [Faecalibacterium prausnitzii]|uniref:Uncharacterized protein n=1 Tax=Faecalibacterium prausnitzii TaxID=853 RepID=A0A329UDA3_9FIRM|nr:hypothetical protein C4N24_04485 [Faecalibacterium prausnitzii]